MIASFLATDAVDMVRSVGGQKQELVWPQVLRGACERESLVDWQ